jgi:hypothetical protein
MDISTTIFSQESVATNIQTFFTNPHNVWIGFGVVIFVFAIISLILLYHWSAYSYSRTTTGFMTMLYFIGALILIGGIFLSLIAYSTVV